MPWKRNSDARKRAKALGVKTYFTGNPCPSGHISDRMTSSGSCVECAKRNFRRWSAENRLYVNSQRREYLGRKREEYNAYQRQYRKNNKEVVERARVAKSASDKKNRAKRYAYRRAWHKRNPEKYILYLRARRARRRGGGGSHSIEDIRDIFRQQRGRCAYCRVLLRRYQVDHIQPLVSGGSNDRVNLQLLCASCNKHKSYKEPIEFARSRGFLI